MNRSHAVVLIGSAIVLGACAHNNAATTPVTLTITSTNATRRFVSDVRKETLNAISKHVPNARPLTVAVDLGVTTETVATTFNTFNGGSRQRTIPSTSRDPSMDGALPTVPDNSSFVFPATMVAVTEVNITYTIKDASGRVIESDRLRFDLDSPVSRLGEQMVAAHEPYSPMISSNNPFERSRILVRDTAAFLASRVKALSR
jgi:hypothetical protein